MNNLYLEGFTENRELSWLRFNERILEEACDVNVPLFERLKFISIFSSNLNEFYMVRVGSLIYDSEDGDLDIDANSGMNAEDQLDAIRDKAESLLCKKDVIYEDIMKDLEEEGIYNVDCDELNEQDRSIVDRFFDERVREYVKPIIIESACDIPRLSSMRSYVIGRLNAETACNKLCLLRIPNELPACVILSYGNDSRRRLRYVLTDNIIKSKASELVSPFEASELVEFRFVRNAEMPIENDHNRLKEMKSVVKKRRDATPDMVIVDRMPSENIKKVLLEYLKLTDEQMYETSSISYDWISEIEDQLPPSLVSKLLYPPFKPFNLLDLRKDNIIDIIKDEDILSSYPYDSMDPFLDLLKEASVNPKVTDITMTIYRLASHPVIARYLMDAAANGKNVRVLMELRARFDEERNIDWAQKFIDAGCKVQYGSNKYKVHSKVCQITIEDNGETRYITQIGTGNYNEKTAKQYTDFSLITYDQRIGKDTHKFLNDVFKSKTGTYKHLVTSPEGICDTVIRYIRRESSKKKDGRIFMKVNSLSDEKIMEELMLASSQGCKIVLLVRGICCLIPGIPMCTENITVVNVVGRFLEHSRVYIFGQKDDEVMYISSADMMSRNLHKRVEVACPIYNDKLRDRIRSIMYLNVADNVKGRMLGCDGEYHLKKRSEQLIDSQSLLLQYSCMNNE